VFLFLFLTANNEKHVQYLSEIFFPLCVCSLCLSSFHERSVCAPSLVSSLGASGWLAITFSNCDHRPSTWLNSWPTCCVEVSVIFPYQMLVICSYCNHTLQTAVEPVHVLQHVLQAGCDIADEEFSLVLEVGLFGRRAVGGGHCRCRLLSSREW